MKPFFDKVKGLFGGSLKQSQVDAINVLLEQMRGLPVPYQAYILATAFHETGGVMAPNVESLNYTTAARIRKVWPSRFKTDAEAAPYVKNPVALANKVYGDRLGNRAGTNDGWNFRGRGQVHITGRENYTKLKAATGVDVLSNPDLALKPETSAISLIKGCVDGWYTGKRLRDYLDGDVPNYYGARAVVNGDVKVNGQEVANYAKVFEAGLMAAGADKIKPAPSSGGVSSLIAYLAQLFGVK